MQSPKKVAKYLGKQNIGHDPLDDTRPPGALVPPDTDSKMPDFEDESLRIHSLTPIKVLEKIRQDVVTCLGIKGSIAGKFSPLEQKLVDFLERIVRKGQCPSILVKEKDLIEVMLCLKKYFDTDSVAISPQDDNPTATINVPVFPALYKYAKDAAFCDQRIRELRKQKSRLTSSNDKKKADSEIRQLRERKDNCLIYYQKIIFSDAAAMQKKGITRSLTLYGKPASLDDLLNFLKKGGRLEQAKASGPQRQEKRELKEEPQDILDDSLGSFDRTDTIDEVVDWRKIKSSDTETKSGEDKPGEDTSHYSFNL